MIILQVAYGTQSSLLKTTMPLHRRYAKLWNHRYIAMSVDTPKQNPFWDKFDSIIQALEDPTVPTGTIILYMDADSIIMWPWRDIEKALQDSSDIGLHFQDSGVTFNGGVMLIRKSEQTHRLFQTIKSHCSTSTNVIDTSPPVLNDCLRSCAINTQRLNRVYNDYLYSSGHREGPVVIRSFHGERFICKARGIQSMFSRASLLYELKERNLDETEALQIVS